MLVGVFNKKRQALGLAGDVAANHCYGAEFTERTGGSEDQAINHCAAQLAERGTFNALISNGQWLFVTATSRLHWLTRRAPFCKATLADPPLQVDFSALTTSNDVVTILSTEPLTTDEHWQPFQAGESLLLQAGEVIQRSRHGVRPAPAAQTPVR